LRSCLDPWEQLGFTRDVGLVGSVGGVARSGVVFFNYLAWIGDWWAGLGENSSGAGYVWYFGARMILRLVGRCKIFI